MELVFVRHGLPERIDGGNTPADPNLSAEGFEQAQALADWWRPQGLDAVVSSPMRRARQTAAPLVDAFGLDLTIVDGLSEFDAASQFYVPLEELRADPVLWQQAIDEWTSPEAEEGRRVFRAGVIEAVESVIAGHGGDRVAVVCHGGVINAYLAHVLGIDNSLFFEPSYTSLSRVVAGTGPDGRRQLVSANERPHIHELSVPSSAR